MTAPERVLELVGRAMGRFSMLRPGDRVAAGVSGGKDSLCLLDALLAWRARAPFAYDVVAVTIEQGKFKSDIRALGAQIARLGVEWIVRDEPATLALVADGIAHGCDVCSRHRRRALYRLAAELGCTTLALGHTADDCAESLLRNILFNGRIASLPPVAVSRKGTLRLVRPLVFVTEDLTAAYAEARGLATVGCACSDKPGVRGEIRTFLAALRDRHPGVADSVAAALGNVNPYTLYDPALARRAYIEERHGSAGTLRALGGLGGHFGAPHEVGGPALAARSGIPSERSVAMAEDPRKQQQDPDAEREMEQEQPQAAPGAEEIEAEQDDESIDEQPVK